MHADAVVHTSVGVDAPTTRSADPATLPCTKPLVEPPPRSMRARFNDAFERARTRLELVYRERVEPALVRVALHRRAVVGVMLALIVVVVAVGVRAYLVAARPTYARHGVDGVDAYAASATMPCGGRARTVADGVTARLREYASDDASRPCVCAPELGVRRRALAVRLGDGVAVLYNAYADDAWDGTLDGRVPIARRDVEAREYETTLFPARTAGVVRRRRLPARVVFEDAACAAHVLIADDELGRCVLRCVDLFDGHTLE